MHKNQKGFGAAELLLIVLFVGAVIGTGVVVASKHGASKPATNNTTTPANSNTAADTLTPQDITAKVKGYLASKYSLLDLQKNNQPKQGEASYSVNDSSPPYKADGYNFYVTYKGGSTLEAMPGPVDWATATLPRPVDTALRQKVADIYTASGLTKTGSTGQGATDIYQGKGLICTIEAPEVQSSSDSVSCGEISRYATAAEQAKPFFAALPDTTSTTVISGLKITDSRVSGYQKASAGVGDLQGDGGAAVLFYRKTGESWHYFTVTQMQLDCSQFNTADLKAAFTGDACSDGASQSTVH